MDQAAASDDPGVQAMKDLEATISEDAALSKSFNKFTLPGQLLRGVAVGFAGASLINSFNKASGGGCQLWCSQLLRRFGS